MAGFDELKDKISELENFKNHEFKRNLTKGLGEFMIGWDRNFHLHTPGSEIRGYKERVCHVEGKKDKILKIKESNDRNNQRSEHYEQLIGKLKKYDEFKKIDDEFEINNNEQLKIFIDKVREIAKLPKISLDDNNNYSISEINNALKYKKQIILSGPPGTGKTRLAKELTVDFIKDDKKSEEQGSLEEKFEKRIKDGRVKIVQFHPSYNYEDFIRGIKMDIEDGKPNYKVINKIFGGIVEEANKCKNKKLKYVFIIDEINRAPLSSVLGELLYALEYRNQSISTLYEMEKSKDIIIPKNLYIIGTMNTADRSIGDIDYAIRRRFAFINIEPRKLERGELDGGYSFAGNLFEQINEIFNYNNVSKGINPDDIKIGTSYFIYKKESMEHLEYKVKYEILPILKEYYKDGILIRRGKCGDYKFENIFRDKQTEKEFIKYLIKIDSEDRNE